MIRRYASNNLLALYPDEARQALTVIDADPDTAAFRFADEHTRCYICSMKLTDAISRMVSVGPHCRGFHAHSGLRQAANEVDRDPARRQVYRALRGWAVDKGFTDPRTKDQRDRTAGQQTAASVAAAWSGLPGLIGQEPEQAVATVKEALGESMSEPTRQMLLAAPPDTLVGLIGTGILSGPLLQLLAGHRSKKVQSAASDHLMALLT